jgi:ABC-type lipoprotein release transport system permease subunit
MSLMIIVAVFVAFIGALLGVVVGRMLITHTEDARTRCTRPPGSRAESSSSILQLARDLNASISAKHIDDDLRGTHA